MTSTEGLTALTDVVFKPMDTLLLLGFDEVSILKAVGELIKKCKF